MNNVSVDPAFQHVLLVEGSDDEVFFRKFAQHLSIDSDLHIVPVGGVNNLRSYLLSILNDTNFPRNRKHIGIVRDSDRNTNAFDSVVSALEYANRNRGTAHKFSIPPTKETKSNEAPYVSVLTLPPDEHGTLEDVVMDALKADPIMPCVEDYFDCLSKFMKNVSQERMSKSRLSVFISGKIIDMDEANNRDSKRKFLREAVAMNWWHPDLWYHPKFKPIETFLKQLLDD